jgi:hypothetical protein
LAGWNAADDKSDLSGGAPEASWPAVCFQSTDKVSLPDVDFDELKCDEGRNKYENINECTPLPDWLTPEFPYVETRPRTLTSENTTILPNFFGQALAGGSEGGTFQTCARATWGPPKTYSGTVPVTFSVCEWEHFMDSTESVYPHLPIGTPGYGGAGQPAWPADNFDRVVYLKDSDKAAGCTRDGRDYDGGFGDLKVGTTCSSTVSTGGWLVGDNGTNISNPCKNALKGLQGTVILVPVFDCLFVSNTVYNGSVSGAGHCDGSGSGGKGNYHIAGWAKFYMSGYNFAGERAASYIPATNTSSGFPCKNSESCISGWFLKGELQADAILPPGGSDDFGTYAVLPAG